MLTRPIYLVVLLFAILIIAGCGSNDGGGRKLPDLREGFSHTDKKPFGAYIAYRQLEEMFYRNNVREEKRNFEDSWKVMADTNCIYINISQSFYTTDQDVEAMMSFVKEGNDVFLAVQQFDNNLLDKLQCKMTWSGPASYNYLLKPFVNTGLRMKVGGREDKSIYQYFYIPFGYNFSSFNSVNTRVLGVNENGLPDFIVVFKGKGRVFVHCDPRAFSNYFLLTKNNYEYLEKAFGYLRPNPDHVYWNNYYVTIHSRAQAESRRNSGEDNSSFSSLSEITKHPPLAAALWLTLVLLALYIVFTMKRRQRVIEMVKPNENTTVTFTETIGRLYLQKKDNKNIADKMITYLNEHIRNKYFLNTNVVNMDFMSTLSRKSGVPFEKVETLYRSVQHAHQSDEISDYQLLALNEQVQGFYKRTE